MHEVLVNRLGGLSLPRKSVVRLTDRPDMTLDVYCGRKTIMQQIAARGANSVLKVLTFIEKGGNVSEKINSSESMPVDHNPKLH